MCTCSITYEYCDEIVAVTRGFPPQAPRIARQPWQGSVGRHIYYIYCIKHTPSAPSAPYLQLCCPFIRAASAADWLPISQSSWLIGNQPAAKARLGTAATSIFPVMLIWRWMPMEQNCQQYLIRESDSQPCAWSWWGGPRWLLINTGIEHYQPSGWWRLWVSELLISYYYI